MKIFKRAVLAVSSILLLASLLVTAIPPQKASAEVNLEPNFMCVLPVRSKSSSSSSFHVPKNWLTIQIMNRATMKVTFTPGSEKCDNPSGNLKGGSIQYIDGTNEFKPLVDGLYRDKKLGDGWAYFREADGGSDDSSVIDQFHNSALSGDESARATKMYSVSKIREFLTQNSRGAEITFSIEEDVLDTLKCPNPNSNFVLFADDSTFEWHCVRNVQDGIRDGKSGFRLTAGNSATGVAEIFAGKLEAFNITFQYDGERTINHVAADQNLSLSYCESNQTFRVDGCAGDIYIDASMAEIQRDLAASNVNPKYGDVAHEYQLKNNNGNFNETVVVAGVTSESSEASDEAQDQSSGDGTANSSISCDVSITNPLTWLICPLVDAANEFVGQLDRAIVRELNINEDTYFDEADPDVGQKFYGVWSNFRNIGLVVLIIAALVMVVSQAMSVGPFDAYTVKKMLPRILVAVIFMTLSWDIMKFLIAATNDISIALRTIIQSPFREIGNPELTSSLQSSAAASLLVGAAGLGLGILGLLSFGMTALLAVLIAFAVLTLRKMLILFLVLIAPFAIVCYILPNTQKVFKFWWDTFSKGLLMFPIVMGFIAIGRVFAQVSSNTNDSGSTDLLEQIIVMVAYFGPYFALPTAFKMAGGAIATISGMANDRSRGVFDRLKKGRQETTKRRIESAKNESLWNPNHSAIRALKKINPKLDPNKLATYAVAPRKNLQYDLRNRQIPFMSASGRKLAGSIEASQLEQSQKLMQHWNSHGANDKFYRAVMGGWEGLRGETQEELVRQGFAKGRYDAEGKFLGLDKSSMRSLKSEGDFIKMASILETSGSDSERKAATALRANAAYTNGLYADPEMSYASTSIAGSYGLAAHGFFDGNDAANLYNTIKREGGHDDLAHAATVTAENIAKGSHPEAKPGYGHEVINGEAIDGLDPRSDRGWAVAGTLAPQDYYGMKGGTLSDKRFGGVLKNMLKAGSGDAVLETEVAKDLRKSGLSANQINKRIEMAKGNHRAVKESLFNVAGRYSSASADNKADALRIINESGLGREFERYNGSDFGSHDAAMSMVQGQEAQRAAAASQNQEGNKPIVPPPPGTS